MRCGSAPRSRKSGVTVSMPRYINACHRETQPEVETVQLKDLHRHDSKTVHHRKSINSGTNID